MKTLALLGPLVMLLTGCDQVSMNKPEARDLVGTYRLIDSSVAALVNREGYASVPESRLELRPDSTVDLQNLPDCADTVGGVSHGQFLFGRGRWQVRKTFEGYGLDFSELGGSLRSQGWVGKIAIRRRSPPYELEMTLGDPDSGRRLRYKRVE